MREIEIDEKTIPTRQNQDYIKSYTMRILGSHFLYYRDRKLCRAKLLPRRECLNATKQKHNTRGRDRFSREKENSQAFVKNRNYIVKYIPFKIFYVYSQRRGDVKSTRESDLRVSRRSSVSDGNVDVGLPRVRLVKTR